jgi:hypothetical protein
MNYSNKQVILRQRRCRAFGQMFYQELSGIHRAAQDSTLYRLMVAILPSIRESDLPEIRERFDQKAEERKS